MFSIPALSSSYSTYSNYFVLLVVVLMSSCIGIQRSESIDDGHYNSRKNIQFKDQAKDSLISIFKDQKIYIEDHIDSLLIFTSNNPNSAPSIFHANGSPCFNFIKNEFDLDLFVVPLKLRPSQNNFPIQLNTQFNTSLYFGYRKDYYKILPTSIYKASNRRTILRNGIGAGVFIGLSTITMNPWVTQGGITSEYDGLAITYGISTIYAVQKFNAGFALGFDYLTDKNRSLWLYQNKPWIGVLVGLNLN